MNPDVIPDGVSTSYSVGYAIGQILIPVVILLIARRNMKGWNQPIKFVWFSFSGRLNRKAYWLKGLVLLSVVNIGTQLAYTFVMAPVLMLSDSFSVVKIVIMVFTVLPLVVFQLWAGLVVGVKRAHDLDHSGWWLLQSLIPIWNIWVAIQLLFFRGSNGPNRFGEDPIDPYEGFVDEMSGETDGGGAHAHAHPRPPQDGGDEPLKGFGRRAFQTGGQTGPKPRRLVHRKTIQSRRHPFHHQNQTDVWT